MRLWKRLRKQSSMRRSIKGEMKYPLLFSFSIYTRSHMLNKQRVLLLMRRVGMGTLVLQWERLGELDACKLDCHSLLHLNLQQGPYIGGRLGLWVASVSICRLEANGVQPGEEASKKKSQIFNLDLLLTQDPIHWTCTHLDAVSQRLGHMFRSLGKRLRLAEFGW